MSDAVIQETRVRSRPPQDFYDAFYQTGPDTLGGKYQRLFWHPISASADLAPGKTKPIKLLSEQFTLYRGETGTLHLTEFHCPHRRTQLSVGYVEGDAIRCLYHGWKFGADGGCVERPAEPGSHSHVKIKTYPVAEFLGLIFATARHHPSPRFRRSKARALSRLKRNSLNAITSKAGRTIGTSITRTGRISRAKSMDRRRALGGTNFT
jgi:phenylpropionate dioxygenase-like ring-hydroxylating dioxygenase large terminal subunit